MSSASAGYRRKLKEKDPEKYAEYLRKQSEGTKHRREERKRELEEETCTRATIEDRERQLQWNREYAKRYRLKKSGKRLTRNSAAANSQATTPVSNSKSLKGMTVEERRAYRAAQKREQRAKLSHHKRASIKKANRERMQQKRARERESKNAGKVPPPYRGLRRRNK